MNWNTDFYKNTKQISFIGVMGAVAFILHYISVPWFPPASWLELELSELAVFITASILGFWPMVVVAFINFLASSLQGSIGPAFIGQITMLISSITLSFLYLFIRRITNKKYIIYAFVILIFTVILSLLNFVWITPAFFSYDFTMFIWEFIDSGAFEGWYIYLSFFILGYIPFNIVKAILVLSIGEYIIKVANLEEKEF